jgi:hypothetical protein
MRRSFDAKARCRVSQDRLFAERRVNGTRE